MKIYSPISYIGAKTNGAKQIEKHLPSDINKMVSIFCGGASFEFYCERACGINVTHAYDLFPPLINFFQTISNETKKLELIEYVSKMVCPNGVGKEKYDELKRKYYKHVFDNEKQFNDFELACNFFILHSISFFPDTRKGNYCYHCDKDRESRIKPKLKRIFDFKTKISFQTSLFDDSIVKHTNDFLYLDPPYVLDGDDLKTTLYNGHNTFNHQKLAELLKQHKGKFLLSYGDCKLVRELYKDFNIEIVEWHHCMEKVLSSKGRKAKDFRCKEVVIKNY